MASELAGVGVTLNIGPSEDACREDGLNLSATCFGTSPVEIAAFARAFNYGHHDRGVLIPTARNFDSSAGDSQCLADVIA